MKNSMKYLAIATFIAVSMSNTALAQFTVNQVLEAPSGIGPSLGQIGGTTAYVPMKHYTRAGVQNHGLTGQGNLDMKFKIGMKCPSGMTVTHLSYTPENSSTKTVINENTNSQSYSKTITIQPFSASEFQKTGQEALGGSWTPPNSHNNQTKTVSVFMKKNIDVVGKCSGWGATARQKTFPALVKATFDDLDF